MTTILHIRSSSNLQSSVTRQVGQSAIAQLTLQDPTARVIERDLVADVIPHLSAELLTAMFSGDERGLALSNQLIDELFAADFLVIEAPMYNFGIPSALKAWIDHVVRTNRTFKTSGASAEGLVKGKKALLVLGSGGVYSEGPWKPMDFQETYLRTILGFIGITDLHTVRIEGIQMGPEKAAAAIASAKQQVAKLFAHAA